MPAPATDIAATSAHDPTAAKSLPRNVGLPPDVAMPGSDYRRRWQRHRRSPTGDSPRRPFVSQVSYLTNRSVSCPDTIVRSSVFPQTGQVQEIVRTTAPPFGSAASRSIDHTLPHPSHVTSIVSRGALKIRGWYAEHRWRRAGG
jgi:hypothetical protein